MTHIDLFAGIGGFTLAARAIGWRTIQFVEIDRFCQRVLKKNFPDIPIHDDVRTFKAEKFRGAVDIITGGFPCQPASLAGKRQGTKDHRWLWPEMLRVIRESQPRFVLGENVPGLLSLEGGLVLDQIYTDLETEGYEVAPPIVFPACGVDAPHLRYRVWIVAHSNGRGSAYRRSGKTGSPPGPDQSNEEKRQWLWCFTERTGQQGTFADPTITRREGWSEPRLLQVTPKGRQERSHDLVILPDWKGFPTEPPVRVGNDGLPAGLVRRSLSTAGNAIVPQAALQIMKAIELTASL